MSAAATRAARKLLTTRTTKQREGIQEVPAQAIIFSLGG